jgi:type VII secretion protein EccB
VQTRRDHLQAYQFSTGRLVHALTAGDPGTGEQPFRRGNLGVALGLMIGLLASGGAMVYGLISPAPDKSWHAEGSIVVEKESGTRYVVLNGQLRPTANYASARLAGGARPGVHLVAHSVLASTPVGSQIGIPGAPDSLPAPSALLTGSWALCLSPAGDGSTVLDLAPAGRTDPAPAQPVLVSVAAPAGPAGLAPAAKAAPASAPAGGPGEYVLWGAKKYPVPDSSALAALGLGNRAPIPAAQAWLDVLATGDPLKPAAVPGAGQPGPRIAGRQTRVGQVLQTTAAGIAQFYVVRTDGLAPISRTEAALLATDPGYQPPVVVAPSDIAASPASSDSSLLRRLPDLLSAAPFVPDRARLCALQASAGPTPDTALVTEPDRLLPANAGVVVPAGGGLLALSSSVSPLTRAQQAYLITDAGKRFAVGQSDALQALGYTAASGHTVPDAILALVPAGPTLSVDAARKEVSWPAN